MCTLQMHNIECPFTVWCSVDWDTVSSLTFYYPDVLTNSYFQSVHGVRFTLPPPVPLGLILLSQTMGHIILAGVQIL